MYIFYAYFHALASKKIIKINSETSSSNESQDSIDKFHEDIEKVINEG